MRKRREKKSHKVSLFFTIFLNLIMILGSGYLVYNVSLLNNIENDLRLICSGTLILICLLLFILSIRFYKKHKNGVLTFILILMLILGGVSGFVGYNIAKVYGTLSKVTSSSNLKTYSSSLVTLKENKAESLKDIGKDEIGILSDEESIEGNIIPNEIIEKKKISNETKSYDSYISMIDALYKGEIKYIFLPTNYPVMFGNMEGYTDIKDKTKIIFTQKKKMKEKNNLFADSKGKDITEPFTVLLMGVDSEAEGIKGSAFNGDSLMVITFNPKTLSTTILSIPRDSYVPIACFPGKRKNKITHAAWKGEECMINTIQNFLDVNIDYYVKINFKGVVSLVDNLGGVDIDVPYSLCEQNSSRQWGENTVYIEQGKQTLNGEQALAYARNRHPNPDMCSSKWTNYNSNDFIRGEHQQEVVSALLNKFKSIKDLNTVYKLLDTISNNMTTNMTTDQILSLYNVFKDVATKSKGMKDMADVLGMQRLALSGHDARIIDYGGSNLSLYNFVLYEDSVKAVSDAMKENLGLKKTKVIKSFSFDINTPYEKKVIGKDVKGKSSLTLLPSFVGQTTSYARSWCQSHGISLKVDGAEGTISTQSVQAGASVEDVKSLTVTTAKTTEKKEEKKEETPKKETNEESKENNTNTGNTNTEPEPTEVVPGTPQEPEPNPSENEGS